ncbi:hypothetical protein [Nostoc sp.]
MILLDKTIFSAFPLRVAVGIASNPETNLQQFAIKFTTKKAI